MQAVRPKAIVAPLQIGLGVQMHRQFGSRFLIDSLHSHGFALHIQRSRNSKEVQLFIRGLKSKGLIMNRLFSILLIMLITIFEQLMD